METMESEFERSRRTNEPSALLMVDLDHFKKINDTFGHLAGDAVLRESMNRVEETIRTYDAVGRFGGEEFIVVLPGAKEADAFIIADRIRIKINEKNANIDGVSIPFTISQGLATCNGELTADELIAKADEALYRAKQNGRNCVDKASL
jgi:two-component system cell cycle response regulator